MVAPPSVLLLNPPRIGSRAAAARIEARVRAALQTRRTPQCKDPPIADAPPNGSDLPLVRMEEGLLLCPGCGSMDLSRTDVDGVLACDDCGASCSRHGDQCPQCGDRGVTQVEVVGFSAPGQSPREAPRKLVRTCDACGYTNAGR